MIKTLSVAVKALARPVINYFAYYNRLKLQESNSGIMMKIRDGLISLGQNFNYYNTVLNRKMFKLSTNSPVQKLSPDKALERGAELITEIIVYSVLIILPTMELIKSQNKAQKKETQKFLEIKKMRDDLDDVVEQNYEISKEINKMSILLKEKCENIHSV